VTLKGTPKPAVTYDGTTYKVRSHKTDIPDLESMERIGALVWINQNTYRRGAGTRTVPNLLAGLGDAIRLEVR